MLPKPKEKLDWLVPYRRTSRTIAWNFHDFERHVPVFILCDLRLIALWKWKQTVYLAQRRRGSRPTTAAPLTFDTDVLLHFLFYGANYEISKRDICGGREIGETGKHRGGEYKIFELSSFLLKGFSERELDVRKLRTDTFGLRLVLATRSMRHKQMRKLKTMAITRFLQQCTFVRRWDQVCEMWRCNPTT